MGKIRFEILDGIGIGTGINRSIDESEAASLSSLSEPEVSRFSSYSVWVMCSSPENAGFTGERNVDDKAGVEAGQSAPSFLGTDSLSDSRRYEN